MAKRVATSELNHDNWDKEEKPEEAGSFRKADDSAIQKRVIRQAKRRSTLSPYSSTDSGGNKNVFANFSGFKTSSNTTIGNFNFVGAGVTPSNGNTNNKEAPVTAASTSFKFGVSSTSVTSNAAVPPSTGSNQLDATRKNTEQTATMSAEKNSKTARYSNLPSGFYSELEKLNSDLVSWLQKSVKEYPLGIYTPVFEDYESHLNTLVEKYRELDKKPIISKETDKESPPSKKPFSFSFGTSTESTSGGSSSSPVGIFGGKPGAGFTLTGTGQGSSMFGQPFGSQTQPTAGTSADDKNKPAFQLSFGSEKPFALPIGSNTASSSAENENKDKEDNDGNDEPPKTEFTPVVEKDAFYSHRCKVFVKKGGAFKDRGVGTLYLKPVSNNSKTQLIVRADTSLGNVLLNTLLSQSMPLKRMGTNNVMLICIPTPEADPPPIPVLLRVKTAEDADSLLKKLEEYAK